MQRYLDIFLDILYNQSWRGFERVKSRCLYDRHSIGVLFSMLKRNELSYPNVSSLSNSLPNSFIDSTPIVYSSLTL